MRHALRLAVAGRGEDLSFFGAVPLEETDTWRLVGFIGRVFYWSDRADVATVAPPRMGRRMGE